MCCKLEKGGKKNSMSTRQKNIIDFLKKTIIFLGSMIITVLIIKVCIKNYYIYSGTISTFSSQNEEDTSDSIYSEEEDINTMINNVVDIFSIKVEGYEITVADKSFGFVDNEEDRNEILENVCLSYINELGIESQDVIKINVNGNINAEPYKIKVSELSEVGELSKEIYQAAIINKELLDMEVEVIDKCEEIIEPEVVIEDSEAMYIGEEEKVEGKRGKKIVYKKLCYNGLNKVDESIIDEVVTVKPVSTIIKKGVKNPYYAGVEFLLNPASGGCITSVFGEMRDSSYHKGIDIAKSLGEDVNCALDGIVTFSGYNYGGYGNLIIVQHEDNMETYYAHLSDIYVNVGESVNEGDIIGSVGSTGYSTGPHLHFELRVGGIPVDPMDYIIGI